MTDIDVRSIEIEEPESDDIIFVVIEQWHTDQFDPLLSAFMKHPDSQWWYQLPGLNYEPNQIETVQLGLFNWQQIISTMMGSANRVWITDSFSELYSSENAPSIE